MESGFQVDSVSALPLLVYCFRITRLSGLHHFVGMEEMEAAVFIEEGKILMEETHEQLLVLSEHSSRHVQVDVPFPIL